MWQAFSFAFNAVVPMLLLMCLGYWLKQKHVFEGETLDKINWFAFKILLGMMAFNNVYKLKDITSIPINLMCVAIVILLGLTAFGAMLGKLVTNDNRQRGVLVQCAFRSNYNVMGIALATELGGVAGAGVSATLMAPVVLYYNIIAVVVLSIYGMGGLDSVDLKKLMSTVFHNSIIVGLLIGIGCLAIRSILPVGADGTPIFLLSRDIPWVYAVISDLAKIAPPLLLILLGATVNFSKIGDIKKMLTITVIMRLILAPIIGFTIAFGAQKLGIISIDNAVLATLVGMLATPSPVISAPMAAEAGCDGELASQNVVWTTTLSMITLMFIIMSLKYAGIM